MTFHSAGYSVPEIKGEVSNWLFLLRILTTPKTLRINEEDAHAFDLSTLNKKIEQLTEKETIWFKIVADGGEFQIRVAGKTIFQRIVLDGTLFLKHQAMIEDYFNTRMEKYGIYATIRSFDDYLYNNVEELEKRSFNTEAELAVLPKCYDEEQKVIVDCNQLAGYDVDYKGLLLTSCWKMYYSNLYFQMIPKQVFLEVQQVQSIEELSGDVIKITLFSHPFNWDLEVNKKYQRLFRDQMGYDQLVWNNGTGVLRPPYIEYAFVDEMIQTVQYQNDQFQPVEKKKATHFVTRSYDYVQNRYLENRTRGVLNAQAYFPWIDEEKQKMMNYRVVNPKLAIDEGLKAYEFYIRQFLEIDISDKNYETFTSVLRFYLPKDEIPSIPLKELQEKLNDINISNLEQKESSARFDLQKAKNHLHVVFLDYSYLESAAKMID